MNLKLVNALTCMQLFGLHLVVVILACYRETQDAVNLDQSSIFNYELNLRDV